MGNLKRHTFQVLGLMILTPLMMAGARTTVSEMTLLAPELPNLNVQAQLVHSLELTPERELASETPIPRTKDLRKEVLKAVKSTMPKKFQHRAYEIARAVIIEANHHQMDPFFLLAVIKTESHFNIKARGLHGEVGLMQILPVTAKWIAAQVGMNPESLNLEDPRTNIRIGATYFASLRKEFSGYSARYIGAYNMGSGNVRKLMNMNMDPSVYPTKVLKNYRAFYKAVAQVKAVHSLKKLQTRNVMPKCGNRRCHGLRVQPAMPNWTTT